MPSGGKYETSSRCPWPARGGGRHAHRSRAGWRVCRRLIRSGIGMNWRYPRESEAGAVAGDEFSLPSLGEPPNLQEDKCLIVDSYLPVQNMRARIASRDCLSLNFQKSSHLG